MAYNYFFKKQKKRDQLVSKLRKNGIETRTTFNPVHKMKMYYDRSYKNLFPNAEILSNTGVNLPSGASLKENQIKKVCKIINNI